MVPKDLQILPARGSRLSARMLIMRPRLVRLHVSRLSEAKIIHFWYAIRTWGTSLLRLFATWSCIQEELNGVLLNHRALKYLLRLNSSKQARSPAILLLTSWDLAWKSCSLCPIETSSHLRLIHAQRSLPQPMDTRSILRVIKGSRKIYGVIYRAYPRFGSSLSTVVSPSFRKEFLQLKSSHTKSRLDQSVSRQIPKIWLRFGEFVYISLKITFYLSPVMSTSQISDQLS